MTTTRTRRAVVTALAGLALTAGLGLGGAGVADAAQPHLTCVDNMKAWAILDNHGVQSVKDTNTGPHVACLRPGQDVTIGLGSAHISSAAGSAFVTFKATKEGVIRARVQTMVARTGSYVDIEDAQGDITPSKPDGVGTYSTDSYGDTENSYVYFGVSILN